MKISLTSNKKMRDIIKASVVVVALILVTLTSTLPYAGVASVTTNCTQTINPGTGAEAAVQSALVASTAGDVICLGDGTFGNLTLSANKSGKVRITAINPGQVTTGNITINASNNIIISQLKGGRMWVNGTSSNIDIDHNRFEGSGLVVFANGDSGLVSNITITNNDLHGLGQTIVTENDLIRLHGFRNVLIEHNRMQNIYESGGHSDGMQTVHGGEGLIVRQNYLSGQGGTQGFFVKDGAVTNYTIEDNLIIDDPIGNGFAISFYDVVPDAADPNYTGYGAIVRRNTVWDDGSGLAARGSGNQNVLVENNVFQWMWSCESGSTCTEAGNIEGGKGGVPTFVNKLAGDYRLVGGAAGITWNPLEQTYGPEVVEEEEEEPPVTPPTPGDGSSGSTESGAVSSASTTTTKQTKSARAASVASAPQTPTPDIPTVTTTENSEVVPVTNASPDDQEPIIGTPEVKQNNNNIIIIASTVVGLGALAGILIILSHGKPVAALSTLTASHAATEAPELKVSKGFYPNSTSYSFRRQTNPSLHKPGTIISPRPHG